MGGIDIERLIAENEALRARVAELEKCVDDGSDSWLLRKQGEAVEESSRLMESAGNSFDAKFAAKDYAQRLRQQADKLDKRGT